MTNFIHTKLLKYSHDKSLFRQELNGIIKTLDEENLFELFIHCYKYYSNIYPDVLLEVFHSHFSGQGGTIESENVSNQVNIKDDNDPFIHPEITHED